MICLIKCKKNYLSQLLKEKNITTSELAKMLHIELSVMKGIESGMIRPTLEILIKMCKILNTSADALILNETREPLSLEGLTSEQIDTVRCVYASMKKYNEEK